jgi:hypothetical protein
MMTVGKLPCRVSRVWSLMAALYCRNVAQGKSERHRSTVVESSELFVSGQLADAEVAVVTGDTLVEFVFGEEVEELGQDGATFVHKVKNRQSAVEHPQGVVAELKSKNDQTAKLSKYYKAEIVVRKILTGQQ